MVRKSTIETKEAQKKAEAVYTASAFQKSI